MSPSEAAAHWYVMQDARQLSSSEEAEFDAWRDDPVNAAAYRKAGGAMALFAPDVAGDVNLRALRQSALEARPAPRPRYVLALGGSIAASLALALVFAGFQQRAGEPFAGRHDATPIAVTGTSSASGTNSGARLLEYRTGVGERRTVQLSDGSTVTLNTSTKLAVLFSGHRRLIRLSRGQALFEVSHDAGRPFTVEAADRQVTALGTIFEVRVDPGRVNVTLIRGRVVVDRTAGASGGFEETRIPPTILKPGQQFDAELGAPQKVALVDIDRHLLWRSGFVEFDDEPLGRAVAEINRYSAKPIVLSNDGVAALRVSGLYHTGSTDQFIDALHGLLSVDTKVNAQGCIEVSMAPRRAP